MEEEEEEREGEVSTQGRKELKEEEGEDGMKEKGEGRRRDMRRRDSREPQTYLVSTEEKLSGCKEEDNGPHDDED